MRLGMGLGLGNLLSGQPLTGFPNDFSFNFDGNNDYLDCGNPTGLQITGALTISAWVRKTGTSTQRFITKYDGTNKCFYLAIQSNGKFRFNVTSSNSEKEVDGTSNLNDSQWHHLTAVYSPSTSLKVYVDGELEGTNTSSIPASLDNDSVNFVVGAEADVELLFQGEIDEVAVWNAELSASDVAKLGSKPVDFSKASTYATDRTSNLKLWLRCGDAVLPESDTAIARQDFYTDFDGTDDLVKVSADSSINNLFATGGTFTAWVNLESAGEVAGRILEKGFVVYTDTTSGSTCKLNIFIPFSTTGGNWRTTTQEINFGEWQHIAITYDGSSVSNEAIMYFNGSSVAVTNNQSPVGTISDDTADLYIGNNSATTRSFNGSMSSFTFYQTILDAQTIKQFAKSRYTPMRDNRFSVVDFDGSNDFIQLPVPFSHTNHSISVWVNHSGINENIFSAQDNSSEGIRLFIDDGNRLMYRVDGNDALVSTSYPNQWVYYVCTYDGSTMRVYANGVQVQTNSVSESVDTTTNARIGATSFENGSYLEGSISSVALYNVTKSAEEVYAIYQQGITYDESSLSGLVGYWRMGDDTSKAFPTIADSSSNSNDGTITNGASDDIVQQMVAGYDLGAFESSSEELGGDAYGRTDSTLFTAGSGAGQWSGGTVTSSSVAGGATLNGADPTLSTSVIYRVQFTCTVTSGSFDIRVGSTSTGTNSTGFISSSGTYGFNIIAGASNHDVAIIESSWVGSITSFSIKEVLQSEVSDTYPAIIDVNEPVLGVDKLGSWTNHPTAGWDTFTSSGTSITSAISDASGTHIATNPFSAVSGEIYQITFNLTLNSGTVPQVSIRETTSGTLGDGLGIGASSEGVNTYYFNAISTKTLYLFFNINDTASNWSASDVSIKKILGNVGTMTNQDSADLVYSSVLPDQSFLTGLNSAYNFIDLDGSNEYIQLTGNSPSGDFTISAWVKPERNGGSFNGLYTMWSGTNLWFGFKSHNSTGFLRIHTNSESNRADTEDGTLANFVWQQVAVTLSGSTVKLFVNGESKTLTNLAGTISGVTSASNPVIGGLSTNPTGNPLDGGISNIAVWDKALSDDAILDIYNGGRHYNLLDSYSDNMISYHTMGLLDAKTGLSDSISTIYDRSGNSNHGTPINTESTDLKSSPNAEPEGYAKGDTNRSTTTP